MVDDATPDMPSSTEKPKAKAKKPAAKKAPVLPGAHAMCHRCHEPATTVKSGSNSFTSPLAELYESGQLDESIGIKDIAVGSIPCQHCGTEQMVEHFSGANHRFYPNHMKAIK